MGQEIEDMWLDGRPVGEIGLAVAASLSTVPKMSEIPADLAVFTVRQQSASVASMLLGNSGVTLVDTRTSRRRAPYPASIGCSACGRLAHQPAAVLLTVATTAGQSPGLVLR
ncbi:MULTISPECIES: hypothetical protein [Streptomyces]|uniref:hypothetical protein n=1 Tax=Streptomyces TaxID=1883 RepID=UPI002D21E18C|nr:hypothetical protein [Streptomyces sp. NRRL F-4707]